MDIKYSFILTFIAGFSTMIGTLVIYIRSKNISKIINSSLSFAVGVMVSVSIFDLIPESYKLLIINYKFVPTILFILIFISVGVLVSIFIDKLTFEEEEKLYKVGLISMIAIIMHNIPEGIATFMASSMDKSLGLSMTIAIAMHNIPEGIAISVPIYYGSKKRSKALLYTFISSISEPFGAFIAYLFLSKYINNVIMGYLFSFIAGIMIQISIYELLKEALSYKDKKITLISILIGTIFMIINLIII